VSMIGLSLLVLLYLAACHARWLVARHFGQSWTFMDLFMLMEAWDHMRYSGNCRNWRALVVAWLATGLVLVAWGLT
jgi:hypothetical protein